MGDSCPPTREQCFVIWKIGEMFGRFTGNGKGRYAKTGVFDGVVVGISLGLLKAEVLDFLVGQLEEALGFFVFLLLTSQCFCAFCTP